MDGAHASGEIAPYAPWYGGAGYGQTFEEDEGGIDPLALLLYVVKYRWLIAVLVAIGLVAGAVVTWMQTPLYKTTAQMEISGASPKVFQDLEVISEAEDYRTYYTALEKLKSRSLAQRVVFELGLADNVKFLFPAPQFAISNLFARAFGYEAENSLDDFPPEQREKMAIGRIQKNLSVILIKNTSLIGITFSDQNPQLAAEIANEVAASFIDQRIDQTSETSDLARQFVEEQVVQVKDKLQASEQALVAYAKSEGITVTGSEISLVASNIEEINNALSAAIQERLDYSRLVQQIEAGRGASLPQVLDSSGIQALKQRVAELRATYQQKRAILKPDFPEMKALSREIAGLEKEIGEAVEVVTSSILLRRDESIAKEADLEAKLNELENEQSIFQDKNIQYTILKREVDSNRSQYETLIGKLNEVGVGSNVRRENTTIVDAAVVPDGPYSPRLKINLAIALALSMAFAAAVVYLLELLNNTFSNPDQIESDLKLPVLGILPLVDDVKITEQLSDQKSALSEAYRSLRTSLQFTGTDGNPRSLLVTSSEPAEGKSTTSFKLGQDFGSLGLRVLIVDADLRKPNLHLQFGTDNAIGLSNLLTNTARREDLQEIFRPTRYANVTFLSAGTIPPNPPDLLSSPKMAMLLQACTDQFDIVILDSPPIMGLSDSPILARMVEGTLLVVSANQVTRKSSQAALKRLKTIGGQVFGATLSKFSANKFEYAYAYRYMSEGYYTLKDESVNSADGVQVNRNANGNNPVEKARAGMRRAGDVLRSRLNGA
ncbi:MAG: polysaccharide biosynthesis tyrosine autokinase [Hyphomicrobiales bacterium]|nr:polysaccharide biosynthesis tyrosine autokinase [Hyphomicrobiales bacterium]